MALLVFPGGLMALSPQEPLTLFSTRALESCMARSARGVCLSQIWVKGTRVNQEEFSIQISCPGLSSLVALCPSAQDKKLPLQCSCRKEKWGIIRALGAHSSQLTERQCLRRTGGMAFFPSHTQRTLCGTRRAQWEAAPFSEKLQEPQTGYFSFCPATRMNNSLRCQLLSPEWPASLWVELLIDSHTRVWISVPQSVNKH